MSIQQAVNQMLGTAGIAARLSPENETKQELYKIEKEEKVLGKQGEVAELRGRDAYNPDLVGNLKDIHHRKIELAKRKFQLDPTEENFQSVSQKQKTYQRFNNFTELMRRQKEAKEKAQAEAAAKKAQKANFRKSILLNAQGQNLMVPVNKEDKR